MKQIVTITALFLTFALFTKPSIAQEVSVSLSPSTTRVIAQPGKTLYVDITLTNDGDPHIYSFRLYGLSEPDLYGNRGIKDYSDGSISVSFTEDGIQRDQPFLMRGRTKENVRVRIDVPRNAKEGEYAYAVVAQSDAPLPEEGAVSARISGGLGSILSIAVSKTGADEKKATTSLFRAIVHRTVPWFGSTVKLAESGQVVPLSLIVRNAGKYAVIPKGTITISDHSRGSVDKKELVTGYVFPNAQRLLQVKGFNLESCIPQYGNDVCSRDYSYIIPGRTFGVIEVATDIRYGENGAVSYDRDYYVVLPYKMLVLLMGILVIVLVIVLYELRKHHFLEAAEAEARHKEHASLFHTKK